jgi:protein-tyrosine kinase
MENIRQAIERALAEGAPRPGVRNAAPSIPRRPLAEAHYEPSASKYEEVFLDDARLRQGRVISQDLTDPLGRSFDMLRTQLLQLMDGKKWKIVAVTSPTPACGKTVTSLNLALSVSRLQDRPVMVIDLDFARPMVAEVLGLSPSVVIGNVLEGTQKLSHAVIHAHVGKQELKVVPCSPMAGSAELMASRNMETLFRELRADFGSHVIIIDLPPILVSDDVITVLPWVDCILLVAAVGVSTVAQIEECKKHLQWAEVARVVLTKASESKTHLYYQYYGLAGRKG